MELGKTAISFKREKSRKNHENLRKCKPRCNICLTFAIPAIYHTYIGINCPIVSISKKTYEKSLMFDHKNDLLLFLLFE
jgi:hypothetical protein